MKRILFACILLSGTAIAVEKTSTPCDTPPSTTAHQKCRIGSTGSITTVRAPLVDNKGNTEISIFEKRASSPVDEND